MLAGGKSRRLGQDKRQLPIASPLPLLAETIARVSQLSDDVIVASGSDAPWPELAPTRFVLDAGPDCGPLGGICSGLAAVRHERALVVACDLPFLNLAVLRALLRRTAGEALVVPRRADGRLEMLHAIYDRACLPTIQRRLASRQLRLSDLAEALEQQGLGVRFVDEAELAAEDPELLSFFNVNTPEDLARARRLAGL